MQHNIWVLFDKGAKANLGMIALQGRPRMSRVGLIGEKCVQLLDCIASASKHIVVEVCQACFGEHALSTREEIPFLREKHSKAVL
jgi:hypothetical protein